MGAPSPAPPVLPQTGDVVLNHVTNVVNSQSQYQQELLISQLSQQNEIILGQINKERGHLDGALNNQLTQYKTALEEANSRDWTDYAFAGGAAIGTAAIVVGGIVLFTGE